MTGTKQPGDAATGREIMAAPILQTKRFSPTAWLRGTAGSGGLVTYQFHSLQNREQNEKRRGPRRRTRLRAGKILDRANRFIVDGAILDRSCGGLRLRLGREAPLPELVHFYDEECEAIFLARIVWRKGLFLGVRRGPNIAATPRRLDALRGRYYALEDGRDD